MPFRLHDRTPRALAELPLLLGILRWQRGISQRQLADHAGVDRSVVRRAELGRDAQLSTWVKLFEALGYSIEVEGFLSDEASERKERQRQGLCAGKWRW